MPCSRGETEEGAIQEAVDQLHEAATAKKCWPCGCLHSGLTAIERAFPDGARPGELDAVLRVAHEHLDEVRSDCLGCEICYPAAAINALGGSVARTRSRWKPAPRRRWRRGQAGRRSRAPILCSGTARPSLCAP